MSQFAGSVATQVVCTWASVPRSVYYYKPKGNKPGRKPSAYTVMQDGSIVTNDHVVDKIRELLAQEFIEAYGYEYMTVELQNNSYLINHKKVYRLMAEHNLLLNKHIRTSGPRRFAPFRAVDAKYSMEYLSIDIKYVWIAGEQRNCYLLTLIDVFSKKVLESVLKYSIRQHDVIHMLKRVNCYNSIKGIIIRNDNGPQFIANLVKNFYRTAEVIQECTHPGTPEENCYIEAYHSILQRTVIDRREFESYYEANNTIKRFVEFYNNRRPHRSIGFVRPEEKWKLGLALRPSLRSQPAGEYGKEIESLRQLSAAKPEQMSRSAARGSEAPAAAAPFNLDICGGEANFAESDSLNNLNYSENTVQFIGG